MKTYSVMVMSKSPFGIANVVVAADNEEQAKINALDFCRTHGMASYDIAPSVDGAQSVMFLPNGEKEIGKVLTII